MRSFPSWGFLELGRNVLGDGIQPSSIKVSGVPMSAPTAAMGWREYWSWMDITKSYSDNGITEITADGLIYRTNGNLGVVANSQFAQTTQSNRPTFKLGGAGGQSYAQFDNVDNAMDSLAITNFYANNAKTVIMAGAIRAGWANSDKAVWDSGAIFGVNLKTGGAAQLMNWPGGAYVVSTGVAFTDGEAFIFSGKHDGGSLYDSKNGGAWTAGVLSGNSTSLAGLLRIGGHSNYAPLDLYALAVSNVVISDANIALVVNYFKAQLGIA